MTVLVTGPESSGKTTLCHQLSTHLGVPVLEEYARSYLEKHGPNYSYEDLHKIAKRHYQQFQIKSNNISLILDTYLLNIVIWSEHKYGKCEPWILDKWSSSKYDAVLLLKPNIKWKYDPLRESKDIRDKLFQKFENALQDKGMAYYIIDGTNEERLLQGVAACKHSFKNNSNAL